MEGARTPEGFWLLLSPSDEDILLGNPDRFRAFILLLEEAKRGFPVHWL
jgi:hypothetical protein